MITDIFKVVHYSKSFSSHNLNNRCLSYNKNEEFTCGHMDQLGECWITLIWWSTWSQIRGSHHYLWMQYRGLIVLFPTFQVLRSQFFLYYFHLGNVYSLHYLMEETDERIAYKRKSEWVTFDKKTIVKYPSLSFVEKKGERKL